MPDSSWNILLTNSTDIYGGGEYYVLELAASLREHGHHVWVSCKPGNLLAAKCRERGVPLLTVDFPPRGSLLKHIGLLKQLARQHDIHVLHTNSNYDRTAGAFAARLAGAKHVTNVHSFHSIRHNPTQWLRNRAATDHFLVDGYCVRDLLVRNDGIPEKRISVVHLGVNPDTMRRDETLRRNIRQEFRLNEDQIVIGNVGRLVPMKGQEFLLKAFGNLATLYPQARLLLVGDGELREHLEQTARSSGIRDNVTFAGFRDDLQAVYSAMDIYSHPSVEGGGETFPFAVLQALAQELPVVVTRVGDVAYMAEEGVNGFVVPDRNVNALGESLRKLLEDQSLRQAMAHKSRDLLLRKFTSEKMVGAIMNIYTSMMR